MDNRENLAADLEGSMRDPEEAARTLVSLAFAKDAHRGMLRELDSTAEKLTKRLNAIVDAGDRRGFLVRHNDRPYALLLLTLGADVRHLLVPLVDVAAVSWPDPAPDPASDPEGASSPSSGHPDDDDIVADDDDDIDDDDIDDDGFDDDDVDIGDEDGGEPVAVRIDTDAAV